MKLAITPITVHKRVPLTISRGTTTQSTNLWVRLQQDGIEGWGEATPFSAGLQGQTTEAIAAELATLTPQLQDYHPLERQRLAPLLATVGSATRAAVDMACHDWLGKQAGLPLWKLWGLDRAAIGPTAVTIGINTPQGAWDRLQQWQHQVPQLQAIKIKLGSPQGMEADQAMVTALLPQIPAGVKISVDANGGWSLPVAMAMADWLAARGGTYLEQPLGVGQEGDLAALKQRSPLPLFVDESCFSRADLPALGDAIDGINIKLMKCGGLSEALALIHAAQAMGLQVMVGCYSDMALANTALAHLTPLVDHVDLDSHLNLRDDPFQGATVINGCLLPPTAPGLGVTYHVPPHP